MNLRHLADGRDNCMGRGQQELEAVHYTLFTNGTLRTRQLTHSRTALLLIGEKTRLIVPREASGKLDSFDALGFEIRIAAVVRGYTDRKQNPRLNGPGW